MSERRLAFMYFDEARQVVIEALSQYLGKQRGSIATLFLSRKHLKRAGIPAKTTPEITLLLYIVKTQRYFVDVKGRIWQLEAAEKKRKGGLKATQLYFRLLNKQSLTLLEVRRDG